MPVQYSRTVQDFNNQYCILQSILINNRFVVIVNPVDYPAKYKVPVSIR